VTEILKSVSEGKKGLNAVNVKREMVMPGDNVERAMVSPGESVEILVTTPSGKTVRVIREIKL